MQNCYETIYIILDTCYQSWRFNSSQYIYIYIYIYMCVCVCVCVCVIQSQVSRWWKRFYLNNNLLQKYTRYIYIYIYIYIYRVYFCSKLLFIQGPIHGEIALSYGPKSFWSYQLIIFWGISKFYSYLNLDFILFKLLSSKTNMLT